MKIYTLPPLKVLLLCIVLIFQFSCSKDSDLLTDYVLADSLDSKGIGNIVVDDTYQVSLSGSIVLDVLSNDTFENEAEVVITETSTPTIGTVAINNDETLTYTTNAEIIEQLSDTTNTTRVEVIDEFTYTTEVVNEDQTVSTETGTVKVEIVPPNQSSTNAKLLFSSGFETETTLEANNGHYTYLSSTDASTGDKWSQSIMPAWGDSGSGIHTIFGGSTPKDGIENEIVTMTGHGGGSTKALRTELVSSGGVYGGPGVQSPLQINNISIDPDEFYIKEWVRVDDLAGLTSSSDWTMIWQYKSEKWHENDGFVLEGIRISIFIINSGGNKYFKVDVDTTPSDQIYQNVYTGFVVPENEWFKLEMYCKIRNDATGAYWAKINGTEIGNYTGRTIGPTGDSLGFMMLTQSYGPVYGNKWFDDIEIWDGIPY